METMPLKVVIFNAIPEAMLLIYLGLILVGIRPDKRRVFIAGIFQGAVCYYVRKDFDFGIHILLQYFSFVLLTWLIIRVPFVASLIAMTVAMTMAILLESTIGLSIPYFTGISILEIMSREGLRMLSFLPYLVVLITITYFVEKYRFTLEQEIKILKKLNGKLHGESTK
ncbi:hypothetical protein CACET_c03290 [Clostridium aceticum]|uniref:Uncharacterized protein n=1 Tax=Clostridium aceticum TaxID=84022 RepID=A0A0D8I9I3_9CLOT|nr:hypothetical protein [Clostridium aceticum]AKL93845.1 hypothetical protein CACET_c03290 [Clostridium aceticum]KJF25871.1 hypothetical protein TZ02_16920 [Clostridium aceticum]